MVGPGSKRAGDVIPAYPGFCELLRFLRYFLMVFIGFYSVFSKGFWCFLGIFEAFGLIIWHLLGNIFFYFF